MKRSREKKKIKTAGGICGIMTGVCWGLSGVFSQYLFTNTEMQSDWFVAVRMLVSGLCMMLYCLASKGEEIKLLFQSKRDLIRCILSGILGTMLFQFSCYGAVQKSNAATAIVLQYLCPVMVMVYLCLKSCKLPKRREALSLVLAVVGIFFIATHGNIHKLVITKDALLWGIGCAFFMSVGTVLPKPLYERYSTQTITSVSLFFGGAVAGIVVNPFSDAPVLGKTAMAALLAAILLGSIVAYIVYAAAIKWIGPAYASLFACVEIPTATVLSVLFLGSRFTGMDLIGFVLIALPIFLLSRENNAD